MKKLSKKETLLIPTVIKVDNKILNDVRLLIESSRGRVAVYVNAELTMLYWHIGTRIRHEILREKRAEYGAEIVSTLSAQLRGGDTSQVPPAKCR